MANRLRLGYAADIVSEMVEQEEDRASVKTNYLDPNQLQAFVDESRIASIDYKDPDFHPVVSVVVPIFGAEYTLDEALASIEVQSMADLEIVCVNDASLDGSAALVEAHAANDDRYVVLTHERNSGYGASMNDGIAASRGEWVAILEPDDYLLPDMYERLLAAPARFGVDLDSLDLIKSPYVREVRENDVVRGDAPKELLSCSYRGRVKPASQPFTLEDPGASHLLRHHPSIWSALYRRSFLARNQIRFHEYPGSGWADNEFFYDTLLRARAVVYLDEPFYVYREETEDEAHAFARNCKTLPFERWQAMTDIIETLGIQNESILLSHIAKGFTYLNDQTSVWGGEDSQICEARDAMFARMNPELVAKEATIPPRLKAAYFASKGLGYRATWTKMRYYQAMLGELVYTYRNNGKDYTFAQIKNVLGR